MSSSKETAKAIKAKVVDYLNNVLDIPFLSEEIEEKIFTIAYDVIDDYLWQFLKEKK